MPEFNTLQYQVVDHVLTLTMNRPERLNAFNSEMQREFLEALDHADQDDEIRAVIVTGEGRGFCAGADLARGAETFDYDNQDSDAQEERASNEGRQEGENSWLRDGGGLLSLRIYEFNKPIIAAINGPAVGVGATLQLAADIRIASSNAKYGFVFLNRGIVNDACSSWFLPKIIGISKALELCYSGKIIDANEAKDIGLVSYLSLIHI